MAASQRVAFHCAVKVAWIVLLACNATWMAPTIDEPAHLAAGIYTWRSGLCSLYYVNPPLTKCVAAIPVLMTAPRENWRGVGPPPGRTEFKAGENFVIANGERFFTLLTYARWSMLVFPLLGAYVCFRWAHEAFGNFAGWFAMLLWCGSASVIGHGSLVTADVPAAAVGALAGYSFWRWLRSPSADRTFLVGLTLGLCWLVKLTWVILPVVWFALWAATSFLNCRFAPEIKACDLTETNSTGVPPVSFGRGVAHLAAACGICLLLLNCGYAFEGTCTPLGDFKFTSSTLTGLPMRSPDPPIGNRFRETWLGRLPVPLPSSFVYGLDAQRQDLEEPQDLYFGGERSETGWWYFYLTAFVLKEPVGFLVLFGAVTLGALWTPAGRQQCLQQSAVWVPAVAVVLLVSTQPRLNFYRYAIPALPFLFIWTSQVAQWVSREHWLRSAAIIGLLASSVGSGVSSVPYALSYVNWIGGGTWQGDRWFMDGNFDWGQDLFALRRWQQEHREASPLHVAYFGPCNPRLAGIEFVDLPTDLVQAQNRPAGYRIPPGWYAISATALHSHGETLQSAGPGVLTVTNAGLAIFESETPVDRAGPSIVIYHIE